MTPSRRGLRRIYLVLEASPGSSRRVITARPRSSADGSCAPAPAGIPHPPPARLSRRWFLTTWFPVRMCILVKGSGDCQSLAYHDQPPRRLLLNLSHATFDGHGLRHRVQGLSTPSRHEHKYRADWIRTLPAGTKARANNPAKRTCRESICFSPISIDAVISSSGFG